MASFSNTITVPKKLVWKKDGKYLELNDHIQYTTHFQKDYEKNDILVSELSSNEIEEAILIRLVENTLLDLFSQGSMNGTVHTCVGQEI